jgi:hypothetical protein
MEPIFCLLIIIIIWESLQKFALHRINIQAIDIRSKLIYTPMSIVNYATSRVITEPIFCILIIIIILERLQKSALHKNFFKILLPHPKLFIQLYLLHTYATSRVITEPIFCILIIIIIWKFSKSLRSIE